MAHQRVEQGLQFGIDEHPRAGMRGGVGQFIAGDQSAHGVHVLLLAGRDVVENGPSPLGVEQLIDIAGEFFFFTHEHDAGGFSVVEGAGAIAAAAAIASKGRGDHQRAAQGENGFGKVGGGFHRFEVCDGRNQIAPVSVGLLMMASNSACVMYCGV